MFPHSLTNQHHNCLQSSAGPWLLCLGRSGARDAQLSAPRCGVCSWHVPFTSPTSPFLLLQMCCRRVTVPQGDGLSPAGSTAQLLELSCEGFVSPDCSPVSSQDLLGLSLFCETNAGLILRQTVPSCLFSTCSFPLKT